MAQSDTGAGMSITSDNQLIEELKAIRVLTDTLMCSSYADRRLRENPVTAAKYYDRTAFLPTSSTHAQRVYCIKHNIVSKPTCPECGEQPKFNSTTGFGTYCSAKCANASSTKKEAIQRTCMSRYGAHPRTLPEVQQKFFNTNFERYGSKWAIQNDAVKSKAVSTNIERYGAEYHQLSDSGRAKITNTNLQIYGTEYPFQNSDIRYKAADTIRTKYGVSSTSSVPEISKRQQIARYSTLFNNTDAYERLNDPEWLVDQHHIQGKTLTQISSELGLRDEKSVSTKCNKFGIEIKHHVQRYSIAEKHIVDFIGSILPVHTTILENCRELIPPKEIDVYIPSHNLAIEFCGLYWHSDKFLPNTYHADKLNMCRDKGIRLITIFEDEWLHRRNIVERKIAHILHSSRDRSVYPRQCNIISRLPPTDKDKFLDAHHIQGTGPGSISVALEHAGEIVAVMTFIKRSGSRFILNRYATSCIVPGGFTKLLEHFKRTVTWKEIITFADLRWSEGTLYSSNGFVLDGVVPPDYAYIVGTSRVHKFNYRHRHLPRLLGDRYDPTASEVDNTRRAGLHRIYNCGLFRYKLINS